MRLNIGCGTSPQEGWTNLDLQPGPGVDVVCNIETVVPLDDDSVDEMLMSHVLEHLCFPLRAMENLWFAAKPGCKLTIRVPHGASDDAWEDPTHVRPYFLQSFGYFSQPYHWRTQGYGYQADWQPEKVTLMVDREHAGRNKTELLNRIQHERNLVREMVAVLRKVSPIRERRRELIQLPIYEIEACAK